jgi:hypothetical protein
MAPRITALYAALIGLLFLALSVDVIRARRRAQVLVGTGGDRRLLRAGRAHANCAEYAPLALLLLALAETTGASAWLLHVAGLMLLAGRASHAYGLRQDPEPLAFRQAGMALTFIALTLAILGALRGALA